MGWLVQLFNAIPWLSRNNKNDATSLGEQGEQAVVEYLKANQIQVLDRNVKSSLGEIDILAKENDLLLFIEVKTRKSTDRGYPFEAVDYKKQRKLTNLAVAYLKSHKLLGKVRIRFDVASVLWDSASDMPEIQYYPAAFEAVGDTGLF